VTAGGNGTWSGPDAGAVEPMSERDEYLRGGFRPVACESCGTTVTVRKSSITQTSVQWHSDTSACPYFAQVVERPRTGALERCPSLADSILKAVANGLIPSSPPGGGADPR
jgi:hypothetical protein